MTSSLVGSEMCIRDRVSMGLRDPEGLSMTEREVERMARRASLGRCPYAVSYTHLTLPTICSV
eukprot:12869899-Prorocentrum_lima.AAC.1